MKKILKYTIALIVGTSLLAACKKDFLDEKPLDFYTPGNSLQSSSEFQAAINYLQNRERHLLWGGINLDANFALRYATDFAVNATDYNPPVKLNDYANTMVPTFNVPQVIWEANYTIITNANVVIDYAKIATRLSDAEKKKFTAEALFFRALSYRMLANLFGGVPLILEEIKVPRRDYVRATREQVYNQCKDDLTLAMASLADIDKLADGKVNKQVAQHLLAEIYISLNKPDEAIAAANLVISNPALGLMTERFGRRKDKPGDVYSDLFELNNYNRSSGNREGLYVIQSDYLNPASAQRDVIQWALISDLGSLTIRSMVGGVEKSVPAIMGYNDRLSGRGVGWIRPTSYFFYGIWKDDFNGDMRNSKYNIVRDFQIDGVPTDSPDFGKWYVADGYAKKTTAFGDTIRKWFPIIKKATVSQGDFPVEYFKTDAGGKPIISPLGGNVLINASENMFKDGYLFRLAETYLIRAEAYIMKGDNQKAATDLNVLRARAKTTLVNAGQVSIDFLLDERLRELGAEELRMLTLTRMGKLYERNVKYNEKSGLTIKPHHNLWPVPFSETERNTEAKLEQNPGY
ncbi:MAG: RagB/SusD family nutrient uptake outer membrane protein [Chitinophagaceae bacterium]